ncbi:MAG: hypothetical protein M3Z18_07805 [Gemmatimonadota bacterium]|nr:hypothetical protein [Gemmatimonadota bacterium]
MKVLAITLALAALATTAPLNAQILGRVETSANANGSWVYVGRDGSGYQIYERRVQDSYGNIVVQRARRNGNGSMSIISTNTVSNGNNGNNRNNDCNYSRSTNSVGDIIFGRSGGNSTNCVDNSTNRGGGGWYQVGNDGNGGTIYERQTRDSNGNLIIQRARRDRNGRMSIISTRNVGNDGTYDNGSYNNGSYNNDRRNEDNDDQGDNENRRGKNRDRNRGHGNNGNHDNNDNNDN